MSLVSTEWLEKNHSKVKIIDASWHMPNVNRNGFEEFKKAHINNSVFFDIDNNSNHQTKIPHMLPNKEQWERTVSRLGISNSDKIIIYDNSDVISSCRCWYTFIFFGHKPDLVSVLNGGFYKWTNENRKITDSIKQPIKTNYISFKKNYLVKSKDEIDENIIKKKFKVIDARSKNRFLGKEKEPRPGLRSGSIQDSICMPFMEVINKTDKTFLDNNILKKKFQNVGIKNENNVVFSCGSGITATVLSLAYSLINDRYLPTIYDGSWAEYGMIK